MINKLVKNGKSLIESVDGRKLFWILNIGIFIFYLFYFYVICQSSYSADDLFNANAKAVDYIQGDSVLKLTIRQMKIWMDVGRFFPFSNYVYLLFAYVVPTRFSYKFLIFLTVYLNNLLFAKCMGKITKSKEISLITMMLFPMCIQLTCDFDSALYCFHMLMQLVLMWSMISLLLIFKYLDKIEKGAKRIGNYWYLIASAFCLCLAVGTYEVGYIMAAFLGLGVWAYTGKIGKTLKVLIPDIIAYVLMLYGNYWFRTNAATIGYDGIAINFDIKKIALTFVKQCYSTLPFANQVAARMHNAAYLTKTLLSEFRGRDIIMVVLYVAIMITIYILINKKIKDIKNLKFVFFIGCALFVFPGILISFVGRYQDMSWGEGHLSNYIQSFGLLLILLTIIIRIFRKCKPNVRKVITIILVCLSVGVLLGQQMVARASVEYRYQIYGYPRDNVTAACKMGLFDEVEQKNLVFTASNYIFDQIDTSSLYTMAAKRHIQAVSHNQIVSILDEKFGLKSIYQLQDETETFYAVTSYAVADYGYVIAGKCTKVVLDKAKENVDSMIVESPLIYINNRDSIDTSKWELIKQNGNESIYRMNNTEIDLFNYNIQ
ncbi:hypothetical protein [[Clostridium] fimetarium]|uniref:Glucosyl transferase GtrII n=1 Tax=[Clostridium] fimetarium TaxID=99656 RepID=A0A1I0P0B4_9FIRM|nr:hypothetical protein [[Clostridium] fimetarium]SEW07618.1 hypothetical protein SAMN05421659_10456 [[Clostridium] fimetarium]